MPPDFHPPVTGTVRVDRDISGNLRDRELIIKLARTEDKEYRVMVANESVDGSQIGSLSLQDALPAADMLEAHGEYPDLPSFSGVAPEQVAREVRLAAQKGIVGRIGVTAGPGMLRGYIEHGQVEALLDEMEEHYETCLFGSSPEVERLNEAVNMSEASVLGTEIRGRLLSDGAHTVAASQLDGVGKIQKPFESVEVEIGGLEQLSIYATIRTEGTHDPTPELWMGDEPDHHTEDTEPTPLVSVVDNSECVTTVAEAAARATGLTLPIAETYLLADWDCTVRNSEEGIATFTVDLPIAWSRAGIKRDEQRLLYAAEQGKGESVGWKPGDTVGGLARDSF